MTQLTAQHAPSATAAHPRAGLRAVPARGRRAPRACGSHARRPPRARSVRRPRGRRARLRPSAAGLARSTKQARSVQLPEQRGADGGARARGRAPRALRRPAVSTRVFFVNSGAEANENALKMAFRMTGRTHVAAVEHSFHGRTAAAGAITWGAHAEVVRLSARAVRRELHPAPRRRRASPRTSRANTAAVIVEPMQGVGGAFDMGAEFLAALRARCDEVGALLIFDEVQCGMGRTGHPFAANLYGVTPDMITTAKALGNGFPCAALLMSAHGRGRREARHARHHLRRRPDGLRRHRSGDRRHRVGEPARERAARLGVHPRDVHRRAR